MHSSTVLAGLLVVTATAFPNAEKLSRSVYRTLDNITRYRPASLCTGGPISTKTTTKDRTITSTITACSAPVTDTTTVTPEAVTTVCRDGAGRHLLARQEAGCTSTTTVSASVATVFTGQYNRTQPTSRPVEQRSPALLPGLLGSVVHRLGQSALQNQKAFEVDCLKRATTHVYVTQTVAEQAFTETVTAETPTVCATQPGKALAPGLSITTTLSRPSTDGAAAGGVCTVTASASSTTTQHLKCAPTNLISEIGGKGIGQTQGDESNTRGLAPGGDPSACCQLCVDTDGCAASEDDWKAGNCFLWYTEPSCGLGFKYSDNNQNLAPGAGFLLQTGCGSIEETKAPTGE
ncbi:Ca2+-modulated nonselective cation channel polycystin [Cercospora zeina]